MHLSPQEKDKLLIVTAALLAERRLNRGLKLNCTVNGKRDMNERHERREKQQDTIPTSVRYF